MQSPTNLGQSIEATKKEFQKATDLLRAKEDGYKKSETEASQLKEEIKNLELQMNEKKQKVLKLQGTLLPTLKREIEKTKMEQRIHQQKISEIQRELIEATKKS